MHTLSHMIQEVIERDSANRNRTANEYIYIYKNSKYFRNIYAVCVCQLEMNERRGETVGLDGERNEMRSSKIK